MSIFLFFASQWSSTLATVEEVSTGEMILSCVSREALLENATVLWRSKAHIIFLIKEWSAEAQRQNSSQRKVTCNDDPSRWIWRLSFQYPVPWLMQGHIYLKMLRLPYNKILGASGFQYYHIYILNLNNWIYNIKLNLGKHVFQWISSWKQQQLDCTTGSFYELPTYYHSINHLHDELRCLDCNGASFFYILLLYY